MISFYPGPSRVYDEVPNYIRDAHARGVLSMNHRSPEFEALCKKTVGLLKKKVGLPKNFTVFFTSSSTECWEVLAQSVVTNESIHIFNGAFGEKWFDYSRRLRPNSHAIPFDRDSVLDLSGMKFNSGELICVTHNETSNGTQMNGSVLRELHKNNPHHLVAVDATSSMAGVRLDYNAADFWFASVQKCFGLPAGLGILAISPRGIDRVRQLGEHAHYNSLTYMDQMMERWQTPFTPNVMGIYLLMRTLDKRAGIGLIHKKIKARFDAWEAFFGSSKKLELLIRNPAVRSYTVIPVRSTPEQIGKIKSAARKKGFLLGEGYGSLKLDTFRIANFPALKDREVRDLMRFLSPFR